MREGKGQSDEELQSTLKQFPFFTLTEIHRHINSCSIINELNKRFIVVERSSKDADDLIHEGVLGADPPLYGIELDPLCERQVHAWVYHRKADVNSNEIQGQ